MCVCVWFEWLFPGLINFDKQRVDLLLLRSEIKKQKNPQNLVNNLDALLCRQSKKVGGLFPCPYSAGAEGNCQSHAHAQRRPTDRVAPTFIRDVWGLSLLSKIFDVSDRANKVSREGATCLLFCTVVDIECRLGRGWNVISTLLQNWHKLSRKQLLCLQKKKKIEVIILLDDLIQNQTCF